MYSSVQFLERAKAYVKTKVSDQAVAELQEVSANPRRFATATLNVLRTPSPATLTLSTSSPILSRDAGSRFLEQPDYRRIERAVYDWLRETHGEVIANEGFPDFIGPKEDELHGYDVKFLRSFEKMLFTPPVVNSILRGYLEVNEGRLSTFTMIVVISVEDFHAIQNADRLLELRGRIGHLLRRYPIFGMVVGAVVESGQFEPLTYMRSDEIE